MAKVCQVTGKRPLSGNNVSHAHNKTRRRFYPNLHTHRFWVESENRFVKLKLSAKLGYIPSLEEYLSLMGDIEPMSGEIYQYLNFDQILDYQEAAANVPLETILQN